MIYALSANSPILYLNFCGIVRKYEKPCNTWINLENELSSMNVHNTHQQKEGNNFEKKKLFLVPVQCSIWMFFGCNFSNANICRAKTLYLIKSTGPAARAQREIRKLALPLILNNKTSERPNCEEARANCCTIELDDVRIKTGKSICAKQRTNAPRQMRRNTCYLYSLNRFFLFLFSGGAVAAAVAATVAASRFRGCVGVWHCCALIFPIDMLVCERRRRASVATG